MKINKKLKDYILQGLSTIRKVIDSNDKLENALFSFLDGDSCVMYYANEDEIKDTFINSIELLIDENAKCLVEYYLYECDCGKNNHMIKEILNAPKSERKNRFNFKLIKGNKEIKCLVYDDDSLLKSLNKIMEVNDEN